jgi:hypothetical protein
MIFLLYETLPQLQKSLNEIGELKESIGEMNARLLKKEKEVRKRSLVTHLC